MSVESSSRSGKNSSFSIIDSLVPTSNKKKGARSGSAFKSQDAAKGEEEINESYDILNVSDDVDNENDNEFIAATLAASNRKAASVKTAGLKKGGGFQAMGLNPLLMKAISRKGFSTPTPIQRKTIPLILENQDVVAMARTGSGKTAAFVIPLINKLKAHSVQVGARAILVSPSRELAIQTLTAVREFGRGTDLRTILLVGGDSLEDQFTQMTSNPDIIVATPGRFQHLMVEMSLDLSSIRYVVFDEADRLFEMGFAGQLASICAALPQQRQTLLFSATLPRSLVEFAKAGLKDPELVRLDTDSKISLDLESYFLTMKSSDKDGALLHLLADIIQVPMGADESADQRLASKKRKRTEFTPKSQDLTSSKSTIIFAATKHHVEYLTNLIRYAGYDASFVYGALDQVARKDQVDKFRNGITNILVVTDVAARGIDIPLLSNVVNYDFPPQPKIFVHRVGRTGRAGRRGCSYSLCQVSDLPYLLDLQLFLGRRLIQGRNNGTGASFTQDIVGGAIPQQAIEKHVEWVNKAIDDSDELQSLRGVALKGEKQYLRSRNAASTESAKRAKSLVSLPLMREPNLLYEAEAKQDSTSRDVLLSKISQFRPAETVFEMGVKRNAIDPSSVVGVLQRHRNHKASAAMATTTNKMNIPDPTYDQRLSGVDEASTNDSKDRDYQMPDDGDIVLQQAAPTLSADGVHGEWQASEDFISYEPRTGNLAEDRAYGVHSGSSANRKYEGFVDAARDLAMDLAQDDSKAFGEPSRPNSMRWDKRSKKYVSTINDVDGSKGKKFIKGEHGQMMAASLRSGRFEAWKKANRTQRMPRTGEREGPGAARLQRQRPFKHNAARHPKTPDPYRDDYHKKKKKLAERAEASGSGSVGSTHRSRTELKAVDDVRRQRKLKQKRREKNARPSRKGRK